MDKNVEKGVSSMIGCEPVLIDAKPVSAASRPLLWWLNSSWLGEPGEVESYRKDGLKVIQLKEDQD
eukprot:9035371-Karenia_brevis.AAC.1